MHVAELEQHIVYGMTDIGRGVTKEGPMYYNISFAQFILVYVGLAQALPNNIDIHLLFPEISNFC